MFAHLFSHGNGGEAFVQKRARMVEEQLRSRGIRDEHVLAAMAEVPREEFIPSDDAANAYGDFPLAIGAGQTISQPYIVAAMVEVLELNPEDRVLEVGTGTGYQAAILGKLAADVWTIERHAELADQAREILYRLGYKNVHVLHGDGSLGLPEHAPFDKILVAAAAPRVPQALVSQLADGGRLVVPVGSRSEQQVEVIRKLGDQISISKHDLCRFVPLVGAQGWEP
ncbi:MAG: protein-L-isoaspartate(D-aspartate) O-methyltransferase [Candidatus Korobacteraceae bacterium]